MKSSIHATLSLPLWDGRTLASFVVSGGSGSLTWDIKELPEGIYLYNLATDTKTLTAKRLVIMH